MRNKTLWLILLTLLWPLIHLGVFFARFGRMPTTEGSWLGAEFLPMGLVGGYALLALVERAKSSTQKWAAGTGYLLASPVAFVLSLSGGLIIHPVVGATILGGGALALGVWLGSWVGGKIGKA
jgi:hypothetical protein